MGFSARGIVLVSAGSRKESPTAKTLQEPDFDASDGVPVIAGLAIAGAAEIGTILAVVAAAGASADLEFGEQARASLIAGI